MKLRKVLTVASLAALVWQSAAFAEEVNKDAANVPKELRIQRITPEGEDVQSARQIVIDFNRPVVPIGRMERDAAELPIRITPEVKCQWRWLNTTTLSCNLGDDTQLTPSTAYDIKVEPGIRAEDGATIEEAATAHFVTQRPEVRYNWFVTWKSPGTPIIRLTFNQPVTKRSVAEHIRFTAGESDRRVIVQPMKDDSEAPTMLGREEGRRYWEVRPRGELPLDSHIALVMEPGIVSAVGPEKSVSERTIVEFDTFPEFAFAGVTCTDSKSEQAITITQDSPASGKCDPMASVALNFTAPSFRSNVKKNITLLPLLTGKTTGDPWGEDTEEEEEYSQINRPHEKGRLYSVYLPGGLKAAQEYTVLSDPARPNFFGRIWRSILSLFGAHPSSRIEDEFGRRIRGDFHVTFETDHRKPNFEMPHHDAVLEKGVDSELPLYVNNLDNAEFPDYQRMTTKGISKGLKHSIDFPKDVRDIQFAVPAGLRDMAGGGSGVVYGYLSTDPQVTKDPDGSDHRLLGQVTPYSVHMKLGHFTSLAWVTDLATGKPVAGARVSLYRGTFTDLAERKDFATASTDASGIALLPGAETVDPKNELVDAYEESDPRLMVRVEKGEDIALLPLQYRYSVDTWSASNDTVYSNTRTRYEHMRAWGTTAQGVYRVGQTIQYKLYVRNESNRTLVLPPRGDYTLTITDPTGKEVEKKEHLVFSEFGAYDGSYAVPESAVMGWYQFKLVGHFPELDSKDSNGEDIQKTVELMPMRVLVSDFTPASFKVRTELNGDSFQPGDKVAVNTSATLYSGGAYTDASARITANVAPKTFTTKAPALTGFSFDSGEDESSSEAYQTEAQIGDKGESENNFDLPDGHIVYGTLTVESAVADDRGKYIASQASASYVGRDRYVGLKSDRWVYDAGKPADIKYAVVNEKGEPTAGTEVNIEFQKQETTSAKVKGAGNAYLTEFTTKWVKADSCSHTSETSPGSCSFTPQKAGSYRALATIKDTKGREHTSKQWLWVTGSDYVLWDDSDSNALPLVPEKAEYKVGDTARYLVRNPYPGATALVTIERYGVMDSFTTVLEGSTPTISFEVKPDYLPGFYLSVIAMSPRVDKPYGKVGEVDLGKPAYRIGYVKVPVKDPYKEITIDTKVAKEEYRPRDTVNVSLHAAPKMPGKKEPIELTAIVLDEAVFDLISDGRGYFDPYIGLFTLDDLDLRNFSLLTRLIGRQKFDKKGANPGGDGGADLAMRNIFKFVAYWNPSLRADASGNASFSFEAPDNLTGWRVLTLGATPSDRFGLGEGGFKVNRPTEIRPVMPNQVMEGDSFTSGFSVMNRTDKERTIKVEITAQGTVKADNHTATMTKEVTLAPYKRATIELPLIADRVTEDRDAPPGAIFFTAHAGDDFDRDGVEHTLPVLKQRTLITAANYGSTTEDDVTESLLFPKNIKTDVGDVSVVISPSVIANLEGAFRYLRDYPYFCWEQRITKAVAASQFVSLKEYLPTSLHWDDAAKLAQDTIDQAASFQAPGGGMSYYKPLDEYSDPYLSAYTALAFNWLSAAGYTIPQDVEAKLHGYLLDLLRHDTAPSFYDEGMTSDVRAMALAALATHGKIDGEDISRFAPHMKRMSLMGKAQFLNAANTIGVQGTATDTLNAILATGIESGGKFSFNEELDDSHMRILATPLRDNCAVLSSLIAYNNTELTGDKPMKLARSITQSRGNRDHWQNTQENIFCLNAYVEYARAFEADVPNMKVTASMDDKPFGQGAFTSFRDAMQTFTRPIEPADAGRKASVHITREGDGRLYYATRMAYAPSDGSDALQNAGIDIHREYSVERDKKWVLLKDPLQVKRGELVKVDLYASLPTARNFVVVSDPIPGGLEPVNRNLANESKLDADKAEMEMAGGAFWFKFSNWFSYGESRWSFYHEEIRHDAVRFYSDYLPAGNYHLSYTAQAIADGSFTAAPTKAEEMYDPDIFGTSAAATLKVDDKK